MFELFDIVNFVVVGMVDVVFIFACWKYFWLLKWLIMDMTIEVGYVGVVYVSVGYVTIGYVSFGYVVVGYTFLKPLISLLLLGCCSCLRFIYSCCNAFCWILCCLWTLLLPVILFVWVLASLFFFFFHCCLFGHK